jgi:prevent-host-death family protein
MEAVMWQLAEAKNKFSEVFTRALTEGPQRVRRRGETVVIVSEAEYERLAGNAERKLTLGEYLLNAPKIAGLVIERDRSLPREVDFGPEDD